MKDEEIFLPTNNLYIYFRENLPDFVTLNNTATRMGRPVKNVLFNLIELADNLNGFSNYTYNR